MDDPLLNYQHVPLTRSQAMPKEYSSAKHVIFEVLQHSHLRLFFIYKSDGNVNVRKCKTRLNFSKKKKKLALFALLK